jgi:membrane-associated protease RseP (regulator of RpoE activity)
MRVYLVLFIVGLAVGWPQAHARRARHKKPAVLTKVEAKYIRRLLQRCNDGNGQSCYAYAVALKRLNRPEDRSTIGRYTRRACVMAYAPACNRANSTERAQIVNRKGASADDDNCGAGMMQALTLSPVALANGVRAQQITRLEQGSPLAKAGLRLGDVVTRLNGEPFTSTAQASRAIDGGGAMIEVNRKGTIVPLAISCP